MADKDKIKVVRKRRKFADGTTCDGKPWFYNEKVKEHFFNPKNIFRAPEEAAQYSLEADGIGLVGSPQCGDGMKMFIKVDRDNDRIIDCKWQTYGCATAIASTSAFSEMVLKDGGLKIDEALKITAKDIADYIGGIPARKFHCSVLAHKAFKEAVNDYFEKSGQKDRVVRGVAKVIDKVLKVTDRDIEHAVLDGALTFEQVQRKTKVGVHDKECIPKVKELIEYYKDKYYGDEDLE